MKVSCFLQDIWGENAPVAKWQGDLGLALRKIRFCGQFFDKRRDKIVTSVSAQSFLTSKGYVMTSLMLQFVLILSDIHEKILGKRYKSIKFCSVHIWWEMGWDGGNCNGHTLPPPNVTKETRWRWRQNHSRSTYLTDVNSLWQLLINHHCRK